MSDQDRIAAFSEQSGDIRQDELTQYRPISRVAIIALLVGLLSFLAIFHTVLWILPVIGIVVAMVALRHTAPPDAVATGRTAAIVGLALSILFGTLAITTTVMEKQLVNKQATRFASGWMNIARSGNMPQAAEWMRAPLTRLPYESNYAEFYEADEDANEMLKKLSSTDAMKRVLALDESGEITFKGIENFTRAADMFFYDLRFGLPATSEQETTDVICSVRRTVDRDQTHWSVAGLALAE